MKKIAIILLLFVQLHHKGVIAQTHLGDSWLVGNFGYSIGANLNIPTHDTLTVPIYFKAGVSNICDSNGSMKFMSNGMNIYDKTGQLIDEGDTLVPSGYYNFDQGSNRYYQTSIFLPMDSGKIYFITPTCNDTNLANVWQFGTGTKGPYNLLWYNIIDANANGGAGKVVKRAQPLLENIELNKTQMMACKHANGKDWWLLKMAGDSNNLYTFLVKQDSIYFKGLQRMPFQRNTYGDVAGQMIFNREGTKWAATCSSNMAILFTADFDRCHGLLSNFKKIPVPVKTWTEGIDSTNTGVVFSPNNRFIYVSKFSHIMQYDTQDSTWYTVTGLDTNYNYFCGYMNLGLAVNNKIYMGSFHGTCKNMSVIDSPDVKGIGCNFCKKCLVAQSSYGFLSNVPCMPNYELGASLDPCWPLNQSESGEPSVDTWSVYPNPTSSQLFVRGASGKRKELYNAMGQLIFSTFKNEIDVGWMPIGVYYLRCDGQTAKVIIE